MKLVEYLFAGLLLTALLMQFSFWGLLETRNNNYMLALAVCTGALIYIAYRLFLLGSERNPDVQKEHSFYYIMDHPPNEDLFDQNVRNRM